MCSRKKDYNNYYSEISRYLYLSTPELEEELNRLFGGFALPRPQPINFSLSSQLSIPKQNPFSDLNDIMEDFKRNGTDSEYCPMVEEDDVINFLKSAELRKISTETSNMLTIRTVNQMLHSNIVPEPNNNFVQSKGNLLLSNLDILKQDISQVKLDNAVHSNVFHHGQKKKRRTKSQLVKYCVFCKNNEMPENVYNSHQLRDASDYVVCPILQNYVCPICFATGRFAHTRKYCPKSGSSWSRRTSSESSG